MPRKPAKGAKVGKGVKPTTPVDAIRHKDTRVNIPTHELRDFVREDEAAAYLYPRLYPRDPSLDPQLVWKGKDEQDRGNLTIPLVPIYIQEKIHPQALIENLRDTARKGEPEPEQLLFADFNGITEFEKKVDFYHHEGHWSNRMILGDSLLVMASLAEKEGLKGKVQMIYVDPPYGIKFGSNWQVSTRKREVQDGKPEDASREPEVVRAFRDTWTLGIHSYLSYLRDRFAIARELLSETGSIFVQIGDENVHLVRSVLDEVFGSECAVTTILVKKKGSQRSTLIDPVNDYLLWYSKTSRSSSMSGPKFRPYYVDRAYDADTLQTFSQVELRDGTVHPLSAVPNSDGEVIDYRVRPRQLFVDHPGARIFQADPLTVGGYRRNQSLPFSWNGYTFEPKPGLCWKHTARSDDGSPSGMQRLAWAGRLIAAESTWRFKRYFDEFPYVRLDNWWDGLGGQADPIYVVQTNTEIVKRCMLMTTDPGDLVLDPTGGSGTTAVVAEQWGRRWITIDTSRVALALTRGRLMSAVYPYYLLADSPEGARKEAEVSGITPRQGPFENDVRQGFVLKRAAHVTSGVFANCAELLEGMSPRDAEAAVLRQADIEMLHDRPYEDPGCVRVSGPFTVESLSPHRVLSASEDLAASEIEGHRQSVAGQFETMIIENLRKAGVQGATKGQRIKFERLDPFAGTWLQAAGEYEENGTRRRVAVSIGPEHGTVGPLQVKEAAKQAVQGVGFDTLIVCGFAFDPHVSEEAKRYGKLTVLIARMNPDLAMGDELLKKTGGGNLFMVFGEPDVRIESAKDGRICVEIHGIDVYDPTTGEIRSSSTDDIACWFIDTNYNGESFFVRHAYFTGPEDTYEKLQRALKAEIDEAAWRSLYGTKSRPFDRPSTGKIAIKVINHYGDEVLKVFPV